MRTLRAPRAALAGLIALPLLALPALAEDKADDPVVATVNGEDIHLSAVQARFNELAASQPQLGALPLSMIYDQLVNAVVESELVTQKAKDADMDEDPEVQKRLEVLRDRLMAAAYMDQLVSKEVTEDAIKAQYEKNKADYKPQTEVHARHILVDSEDKAKEIIKKLADGADFAELAKESSDGPSGANGGDLGYFTKDRMVPAFAEAAFSMKPGDVSKEPVKTEFGWHVIKVEDSREVAFPELETVRGSISDELATQAISAHLDALRADADITLTPPPEIQAAKDAATASEKPAEQPQQ